MDTFVPVDLASGEDWEQIGPGYVRNTLLNNFAITRSTWMMTIYWLSTWKQDQAWPGQTCAFTGASPPAGERTLAQMGSFRPFPNYANYRGPIKKFYMTGPSCHPGGGICGMGSIAANEILLDLGLKQDDDDFDF